MEQIRAFIAINLPDDVKSALSRLQARLKTGERFPVKWVDPYSIHLTLKFLGNIPADTTGRINTALEGAVRGIPPFQVEIRGLGVFPNLNRVQVVWVGVGGEIDLLLRLQRAIDSGLSSLGFAPEKRRFTPHLTLARVRDRAAPSERQSLGRLIADTKFEDVYRINVDSVNLMKSQLTREGAVYTRINSVVLKQS